MSARGSGFISAGVLAVRHRTDFYPEIFFGGVNIGGVSAHLGAAGRAHVVTAKSGLVGLTRGLASEFAAHGVTVNCVVPGKIGGQRSHTAGKGIEGAPPVGREGVPEDVADLIHNICRPQASYMTGQTIHVSGGLFMP